MAKLTINLRPRMRTQHVLLLYIANRPLITVSELAFLTGLSESYVQELMDILERDGEVAYTLGENESGHQVRKYVRSDMVQS